MDRTARPPRRPLPPAAGGYSLVEVLIAAALLLFIAIGVIPLFTRSIINNVAGADSTSLTSFSRSTTEALYQSPFSSPGVSPPIGETELLARDYYSPKTKYWTVLAPGDDPPADDPALWLRTVRVHQYNISSIAPLADDFELTADERLDGGEDLAFVHLKEIEVELDSPAELGPLGRRKSLTVRVLRAF
jgi:type II secretory pathway pseudopilin PulG